MDDSSDVLKEICRAFGLGEMVEEPTTFHGGVNRVWRVHTSKGAFGVHELLGIPSEVDVFDRCRRIYDIEVAALHAGIRLPTPVPDPATGSATMNLDASPGVFTVHHWVEASTVTMSSISTSFARSLGESLGRLHDLELEPTAMAGDLLDRRPSRRDWLTLASQAEARSLPWAPALSAAADELAESIGLLDSWDAGGLSKRVTSHRDLTPMNTLSDRGIAVLIDWESAGPVACSAELGRTALDHFLDGEHMDEELLAAYLAGYAGIRPLPPIGPDWCSLWIRGLVVFGEHCARSCIAGTSPPALLDFQSRVVDATPTELTRRVAIIGSVLAQFEHAMPRR